MTKLMTINASMLAGVLLLSAGCVTPGEVKYEHVETRRQVTSNDNTNLVTILGGQVKVVQGDISGIQNTIDQVKEENRRLRDAYDRQKEDLEEASDLAKEIERALVAFGGSLLGLASGNPTGTFDAAVGIASSVVRAGNAADAAQTSANNVLAALDDKSNSANARIEEIEDGVEANTASIKSWFDKLNGELQKKITDAAADSKAIEDLGERINDLPDEAARKTELEAFLRGKGFTPEETKTLFSTFSLEELLALLGVGGGTLVGGRFLSRSKERIATVEKENKREIAAAKAEVLAKIEATKPTNVTPPGKPEA